MKRTIKLNESQLRRIIKESVKKVLNERVGSASNYCPAERNLPFDLDEIPGKIADLIYKPYRIEFRGAGWNDPGRNPYGWGEGRPASSGVDNVKVTSDGGLGDALRRIAGYDQELATAIKNDFSDWCQDAEETNTEWNQDDDWEG